ncbi:mitochondrial fission 1 protein-like isoform X2 [Varroa jacobsoni]|uniref:Mitochondrial fission 1 protein n=1 Tax=Varroa destructor TaxID=109461 RepID=A0A7M7M7D2_VARDE|nr:mitochondrial fission 1 protein-like isoform X2 [Varroa destructor]XP_022705802.1 mitochondrial fission 1 protein-like isoform X2 [Varroa jacobsoni]
MSMANKRGLVIMKFEQKYNDECRQHITNPKTKFDYAWCLLKSKYRLNVCRGVILMEELFRDGDETVRRDYIYYIAFGKCKLREYSDAQRYIKAFLEMEPANRQARELHEVIVKRSRVDSLTGAAIVTSIAAFVLGVGIALLKH